MTTNFRDTKSFDAGTAKSGSGEIEEPVQPRGLEGVAIPDWLKESRLSDSKDHRQENLPGTDEVAEPAARGRRDGLNALPNGGLPDAMPDWLQEPSELPTVDANSEVYDLSTFLTEDDLPDWIRRLSTTHGALRPPVSQPRPPLPRSRNRSRPTALPPREIPDHPTGFESINDSLNAIPSTPGVALSADRQMPRSSQSIPDSVGQQASEQPTEIRSRNLIRAIAIPAVVLAVIAVAIYLAAY